MISTLCMMKRYKLFIFTRNARRQYWNFIFDTQSVPIPPATPKVKCSINLVFFILELSSGYNWFKSQSCNQPPFVISLFISVGLSLCTPQPWCHPHARPHAWLQAPSNLAGSKTNIPTLFGLFNISQILDIKIILVTGSRRFN